MSVISHFLSEIFVVVAKLKFQSEHLCEHVQLPIQHPIQGSLKVYNLKFIISTECGQNSWFLWNFSQSKTIKGMSRLVWITYLVSPCVFFSLFLAHMNWAWIEIKDSDSRQTDAEVTFNFSTMFTQWLNNQISLKNWWLNKSWFSSLKIVKMNATAIWLENSRKRYSDTEKCFLKICMHAKKEFSCTLASLKENIFA